MNQQKIRVAVRIRPMLESEQRSGHQNTRIETYEQEVQIKEERSKKTFKFDHVLQESATQQQVYKECDIDQLISSVIEGYHATIFAYGQTGTGKTYTMEGQQDGLEDGIIPKAVQSLFQKINKNSTMREYQVYCSFLQIYNERIYDLLGGAGKINGGPQQTGLKLRWNIRDQFTVENLFIFQCKNADDVMHLFRQGVKNRITASHKLNLNSSRSHSILEIRVESVDIKNPDSFMMSKLELVDLAGSERISLTGAEGKQAKESIEINKSLMTLRQVIAILADTSNKTIPPYRDSKLTCLLKQSIGGNSFCLMIACLSPNDQYFEENLSTLQYATKAAYITNIPIKNDDPKLKIINDLKAQITNLKNELTKANDQIQFLTALVEKNEIIEPSISSQSLGQTGQLNYNSAITYGNLIMNQHKLLEKQESFDELSDSQFNEKLVDQINMVKELLLSNKEMREREEQINSKCDQMQREILLLQKENFELREKLWENDYRESPSKKSAIKKGALTTDEPGFLPEQMTQFQRNLLKDQTPNKEYTKESSLMTNRNIRASSQRAQGRQLPQLIWHQQHFEEMQHDEMTNFGRRSLYQKQMKQ